jgi:proline iminopeptidase
VGAVVPDAASRPVESLVTVNGVQLFTRAVGSGPDVVVLHGGPGAHHDYLLPQFDSLAGANVRRLRYYDQRGGGRSPVGREVPVGWREHVADLGALLDHWASPKATLLGYSWGGLLALLYATEHPDRVARLALVSPAAISKGARGEFEEAFAARQQDPSILAARDVLQRSGLKHEDPASYRQRLFELSVAGYFADPARASELTPFRVTGRTQDAVWQSLAGYDLRERVAGLTVPALVLHGRLDPIPLWSAEETARLLKARLEILEHSGHVPYVEAFDRFHALLDAFLPRA